MVKLIRLASQNNCNFQANFSNDILVPPGSKLALQNVSFKTEFKTFAITSNNNKVTFKPGVSPLITTTLDEQTYTGETGYNLLLEDLELALNGTLNYKPPAANPSLISNGVYGDFYIARPNRPQAIVAEDFNTIHFRYATVITPWGPTFNMGNGRGTKNVPCFMDRPVYDDFFDKSPTNIENNHIMLNAAVTKTLNEEFNQVNNSGWTLSKGAAIYMSRIGAAADNGSGAQDNGAAIGLTNTDLGGENWGQNVKNIPGTSRQYEIRFNRAGETYKFIDNNGFEQDSGVLPESTMDAGGDRNDIMFFLIGRDETDGVVKIKGGVWQETSISTSNEFVFFERALSREQRSIGFNPYLYIRDPSTKLFGTSFSMTNFIAGNTSYELVLKGPPRAATQPNDYDYFMESRDTGVDPPTELIPELRDDRYYLTSAYTAKLNLHIDIWELLGFSRFNKIDANGYTHFNSKIISDGVYRWWGRWIADKVAQFNLDDNFIVEVYGLPLDCYDASERQYGENIITSNYILPNSNLLPNQGRRKNILMTLPTNDNNNGLVQYETSTPVFIDLINTAPIILRNLQIKVLRKDFSPIQTLDNISLLTVLLDTRD